MSPPLPSICAIIEDQEVWCPLMCTSTTQNERKHIYVMRDKSWKIRLCVCDYPISNIYLDEILWAFVITHITFKLPLGSVVHPHPHLCSSSVDRPMRVGPNCPHVESTKFDGPEVTGTLLVHLQRAANPFSLNSGSRNV